MGIDFSREKKTSEPFQAEYEGSIPFTRSSVFRPLSQSFGFHSEKIRTIVHLGRSCAQQFALAWIGGQGTDP